MSHDARITDLECKLAFQEDTIEVLNQSIVKQQAQIEQLIVHIQKLQGQISSLQEDMPMLPANQEPPPPHY